MRTPYRVPMFRVGRSPIRGDSAPYIIWRRPYGSVAGHAHTPEGARELARALTDRHKSKECACERTGRLCCDDDGRVPSRAPRV